MTTRHGDLVAGLRRAVFESAGVVDASLRQAAGRGDELPEPWTTYLTKVRDASYQITDADLAALAAAGCTEEAVFELTVAAATGAALQRLDRGLNAMRAT